MSSPAPSTGSPAAPARVFLVEDHGRLRDLLETFLCMQPDLDCCGTAECAEDALARLERGDDPDLLMVDLALPGMSGIDLVRAVRDRSPGQRCLVFSGHREPRFALWALRAGAGGYVLKGDPEALADAIRRCMRGETVVSPELSPLE